MMLPAVRLHRVQAQIQDVATSLLLLPSASSCSTSPLARGQQLVAVLHLLLPHLPDVVLHQHLADRRTEERLALDAPS